MRSRLQLLLTLASTLAAVRKTGPAALLKLGAAQSAAGGGRVLALDVAGVRLMERAQSLAGRPGLFPEQRLRFLFDAQDRAVLVRDWGGENQPADADITHRSSPLPDWLSAGLPVIDQSAAAAILEETIFFEPFGREDAWRLVTQGCEVQVRLRWLFA